MATLYTEFLTSFTQIKIKEGFRGTVLHQSDPEAVLSQLDPVLEPPSLPLSQDSLCEETQNNTQEVDR